MNFKLLSIFLICLVLISSAYARNIEKELYLKAVELNSTRNIISWVNYNVEYKFFWNVQSTYKVWDSMIGDCSDRASLKKSLLNYSGVHVDIIHGYCNGFKHDYLRYCYDYECFIDENVGFNYCNNLTYVGRGYW